MKKIILLLVCFTLNSLNSQNIKGGEYVCNSQNNDTKSAIDPNYIHRYVGISGEYCIQVKLHKITIEGTPVLSNQLIENQINKLNDYFATGDFGGITFYQSGEIEEHNYNDVFNSDLVIINDQNIKTADWNSLQGGINTWDSNNHLDLYFSNNDYTTDPNLTGASVAYFIADRATAFIRDTHINTPVIAHEVGHIFGLFHPFHGTYSQGAIGPTGSENNDGFGIHTPECSDGTNAFSSGDYVGDTLADPGGNQFTVFGPCQAQISDPTDACNGEPFPNPDVTNFMHSNNVFPASCGNHFTNGQISRMKYFINDKFQSLLECPPDPCHSCHPRDYDTATTISEGFSMNMDCNEATLALPDGLWYNHCDTSEFLIQWANGQEILSEATSPITMDFSSGNNSNYTITPIREGLTEPCTFEFETGCGNACSDCRTTVQAIANSFNVDYSIPCATQASLTIPDLTECFSGQLLWGDSTEWIDLQFGETMSHTYSGTGYFQIEVTLTNLNNNRTCRKWISGDIANICLKADNILLIHPNPIKPNQELQFTGIDSKDINKIEILDMLGRERQVIQPSSKSLFIGNLKPGIYFVKFYTAKGIQQKRLIIN